MRDDRVLGDLEHLVLLAVLHLDAEAYGVAVADAITARTGLRVALGSVYTTLNRLENKGLLNSRREAPTPVRGGRSRRCYRVTPAGRGALEATRIARDGMWRGLEPGLETSR